MTSVNFGKHKNTTGDGLGPNYNFQHFVFTTKYRNPVFDNRKIIEVAREAFYNVASRNHIEIKELSFGEDFAHVHMEVSVSNTMTIAYAVQMLKGYSSWALFREIPSLKTEWFWGGEFWCKHYGNGSVGPRDEKTVQNYITRQDISNNVI